MPSRILKESICHSEDIDALSEFEENFYYRLIVNCDDYGIFDGRYKMIKARLYPLRDIKESKIEDVLKKLVDMGMIILYFNNNTRYIQIIHWANHQQVRAKKSKFPQPDDEGSIIMKNDSNNDVNTNDINCNQEISNENIENQSITNVTVNQSNPIHSESNSISIKDMANSFFEKAWSLYPNKKGKGSIKATTKLKLYQLGDEFIRAIERYSRETEGTDIQFIKHGSTFFNSGYEDYLDANYKERSKETVRAPVSRNKFINYKQDDDQYDFEEIEKLNFERLMKDYGSEIKEES